MMQRLLDALLRRPDPSADWTVNRLRAIEDKPTGPRYPTGMFTIYDPSNLSGDRVKHFDNFMRSRQERIAEAQPQPQQQRSEQTANGRSLLPSEEEPDMERDRR
jgi:hypothetical protein